MFNIGFGELAVICIVLIIVVGPERLPSMMKTLGKTIRTLRQASRDIRASTGIDELMREDFDLYAPIKPVVPKPPPAVSPEQPALPAPQAEAQADAAAEPKPVSREDGLEATGDRPSVVVAPPPQSIGSPALQAAAASELASAGPDLSLPSETEPATDTPAQRMAPAPEPTMLGLAPVPSSGDTLPRAALPETQNAAFSGEPTLLAQAAPEKTESAPAPDAQSTLAAGQAGAESSRETKQSGA